VVLCVWPLGEDWVVVEPVVVVPEVVEPVEPPLEVLVCAMAAPDKRAAEAAAVSSIRM
jgi:hypothetical protein